jgi:hypothetical protein
MQSGPIRLQGSQGSLFQRYCCRGSKTSDEQLYKGLTPREYIVHNLVLLLEYKEPWGGIDIPLLQVLPPHLHIEKAGHDWPADFFSP